jgi:hypothetical protein
MANKTYGRFVFLRCGACPESNPEPEEGEFTPIFDGPRNRDITPSALQKFADPIMRVQRGYSTWSAAPCGKFKSDTGGPSGTPNSNSIYTKYRKITSCSSSGECENDTYPTRKSDTLFIIDPDNGSCTTTNEEVQACSEGVGCAETFDTYYEFFIPETSGTQWTQYDTTKNRNYDFNDVYNIGNEYYWFGTVISYRINKSFIDPITGDSAGSLRGELPKLAVTCHNLVIGFNYIFGYDQKYRASLTEDWTITKKRIPFTATENSKDFGNIVESPSNDDEDDYNAMGSVSLNTTEGHHRIDSMAIIIDFPFNNCPAWRQ